MDLINQNIRATLLLQVTYKFELAPSPDTWIRGTVKKAIKDLIEVAKGKSFIPQKIQILKPEEEEHIVRDIKMTCCYVKNIPEEAICEIDEQGKQLTTKTYKL